MRNIAAVLHGHKHIPRVEEKDGIAIFGCGSTTGKVQTASEGETYMSINVVNVNSNGGRISCRVRVERIVGAGLSDVAAHEILYRKPSGTVS
jgi:predicted phosphodiesterase